jgi:plasmid stabilization system protein ParE
VRKLRKAADRLRQFPEAGWVIDDIGAADLREIVYDRYRILYRFDGVRVVILRVWPAGRILDPRRLESE